MGDTSTNSKERYLPLGTSTLPMFRLEAGKGNARAVVIYLLLPRYRFMAVINFSFSISFSRFRKTQPVDIFHNSDPIRASEYILLDLFIYLFFLKMYNSYNCSVLTCYLMTL